MRLSKPIAVTLLVLGLAAFFAWAVARKFRPPPRHGWEEHEQRQEFGRPKRE